MGENMGDKETTADVGDNAQAGPSGVADDDGSRVCPATVAGVKVRPAIIAYEETGPAITADVELGPAAHIDVQTQTRMSQEPPKPPASKFRVKFNVGKFRRASAKGVSTESVETDVNDSAKSDACVQEREFKRKRRKIGKNLMAVSIAFLLVFTAYQSLLNLQSSLNATLGTGSLSMIYVSLMLSCMFVPSAIIKTIGCKWTIVVCIAVYGLYMLANFIPSWGTLVPSSLILGAATAPLWSAKCTYLTSLAIEYAQLTRQPQEEIIGRFFGIFYITFQTSQIWGNWLSSAMLDPDTWEHANATSAGAGGSSQPHFTDDDDEYVYSLSNPVYRYCGGTWNACDSAARRTNATDVRFPEGYYKLAGVWIACIIAAAIIIAALFDQLDADAQMLRERRRFERPKIELSLFISTVKHLRNPHQVALIPLTIYSGMEQAFVAADFTKAYVTCAWGVHMVGYVMIVYGIADSLCSICFGRLVQLFGRIPLFMVGSALNVCMMITLFEWRPTQLDSPVFFAIAASWGVADAVWQTQINSLYGMLFAKTQKAAFSNYRVWESLGFTVAFGCSHVLCARVKLFILLSFLLLGMTGYGLIEMHMRYIDWKEMKKQKILDRLAAQTNLYLQVTTSPARRKSVTAPSNDASESALFGQGIGNFLSNINGMVIEQVSKAGQDAAQKVTRISQGAAQRVSRHMSKASDEMRRRQAARKLHRTQGGATLRRTSSAPAAPHVRRSVRVGQRLQTKHCSFEGCIDAELAPSSSAGHTNQVLSLSDEESTVTRL